MQDFDSHQPGVDPYLEPERTSLAAIFGFICSLGGCCVGVTALLGLPLSIFGLVSISRSNKRLGGTGFAVAGLLLGLLNLALWGGCLGTMTFGVNTAMTQFGGPTQRLFEGVKSGSWDGARANLISPAADVSDEELAAFHAAYSSTLGEFQSLPDGLFDYFERFAELRPILQAANGRQNIFPMPATFDAGPALILIGIANDGSGVRSITVIDTAGNEYTLPMPKGWEDEAPNADTPTQPDAPDEGSGDGSGGGSGEGP